MQLELVLQTPEPQKAALTLSDIAHSIPVAIIGSGRVVMRVKPTGFLLNSTVVCDILNRGDTLVVALKEGTVYGMRGTTPVTEILSKLLYSPIK